MRKNYIYLVLLLAFSTVMFAQKVTLTPTVVNGVSYSSGAINLAGISYSTIALTVKVEIPDNVAVNDQGTIKIYSSNSAALGSNVTIGGDGGFLYFGGGKVAIRSFNINLSWGDFFTSNGYIYAEYKTYTGTSYKSSNIAVIKNSTLNGGGTINPPADAPNPTKIPNTLCCNQTIRQGEKPSPIAGSQYNNPYSNQIYGINGRWTVANGSILNLDETNKILNLDYNSELKNITIYRELGYNGNRDFPSKSNVVTITVVPSPIISNEIRVDGSINIDGSIEISNTNPKDIFGDNSFINLNVLQNPFYVPKRGDASINIDKYEWEYRITNGSAEESSIWTKIPNQYSASINSVFLPRSNSNTKDNFYILRRIAIYENLKISSNTLKISLRTIRDNNTICCDQTLQISPSNVIETPITITGTTSISDKNTYLQYQWQSQIVFQRGNPKFSNWTNIPNATSKDFLPPTPEFIPGVGRNEPTVPTHNYRRIATDNAYNGETYYSNEISVTPFTNVYTLSPLMIYPNPATTVINIENTNTQTYGGSNLIDSTVSIVNIMGHVVNSNNFTLINPNLISIDISNLAVGTYFITISGKRTARVYTEQFTFIKQ